MQNKTSETVKDALLSIPKFFVQMIYELCRGGVPSFSYMKYHLCRCGLNIKASLPYLARLLGRDWVKGFILSLG
jgi:hypothetical protein